MTESNSQNRAVGYARVSTYGQTLDAQLEQLKAAGCAKVYREKATGAKIERRELQRMLKHLAPGDVVTVTRIDRLARSTFDLFSIVKGITDAGGQFQSLAEPWAESSTSTERLMLAVLGGLADVERDLIRTRTAEGRSRATARGQHRADHPPLPFSRPQRRGSGGRTGRRSRNSQIATTSARPRFHAQSGQSHYYEGICMAKIDDADVSPYIDELRHAVPVVSMNYDVWWSLKNENRKPYAYTMNQYLHLFATSINAHFVAT